MCVRRQEAWWTGRLGVVGARYFLRVEELGTSVSEIHASIAPYEVLQ